jgi:hypothetical protein
MVIVGVNSDVELPPLAWYGLNSGVEAEEVLLRKSEDGKKSY